ncbi:MAG: cell division protein FtsH [Elusimicrobia bacterium HGW-Elusimicrobia-1]|jgi:cell division protease FtsH|nr:MAG: cell division protein FtsH [Elusimicrobia bacterium HGW-Elusimicrobia-1]
MKDRNWGGFLVWVLLFLGIFFFMRMSRESVHEKEIPYSEFHEMLKAGRVASVSVKENLIKGEYTDAGDNQKKLRFKTVPLPDSRLAEELGSHGVASYSAESGAGWLATALLNFGPIILFIIFWLFMLKNMQGGGKQAMTFARSRAKLRSEKDTKITFKDVAGCDEAKEELQEIIEFLRDPRKFLRLGGKIPKGVLLYGAPGTGKTLLAKAVAGEAGVPFFSSSGSEFVEMFVGVGASRVRDLFEQGRKSAPCLLFIDEIDAVGRHRGAGLGGGHDEREQTLNQILVEMDGFDTKEGVILIAATNRPDVLDPALLRSGRFDRHVNVPTPDLKGREEILRVHSAIVTLSPVVDIKVIARRTPGFVGADLANLVNEAALLASRRNLEAVGMKELEDAIDRVIAGPEKKSRMISEQEKNIIAYHEAGHALAAKMIPGTDPVHKVSIIPRGPALGYTLQLPLEDRYLTTRSEIFSRLAVLLAGRSAEELIFGEITTGAQNDLAKATDIARKVVSEFGMSERIGPLSLRRPEEEIFLGKELARPMHLSEKTLQIIDEEVKKIVEDAKSRVYKVLEENKHLLERLAKYLVEREVLDSEDVDDIINGREPKKNGKENIGEAPAAALPAASAT